MFYVTGDVHADIKDLFGRKFGHIGKEDAVVICGDLGLIWDGSEAEKKNLKRFEKQKYLTLFVEGAHENFDLLRDYPVSDWNGGKVQVISEGLIHLMRGQVYTINGRKVFAFGGGESPDKEMRTPHVTWWEQELPSMEEMKRGIQNLVANDWQVDYIFTHDAPAVFRRFVMPSENRLNALNVYFDYIREKCTFKKWVFGSYHRNKRISAACEAIFGDVLKLD